MVMVAIRRLIAADMDTVTMTITLPQLSASAFLHPACLQRSPRSAIMTIIRGAITRRRHAMVMAVTAPAMALARVMATATADITDTAARPNKRAVDSILGAAPKKRPASI